MPSISEQNLLQGLNGKIIGGRTNINCVLIEESLILALRECRQKGSIATGAKRLLYLQQYFTACI